MVEMTVESLSIEDTHRLAERMAHIVLPGDVLALKGDLGAGKTTFTQGFAEALGVTEFVNSPTFTIIKEYMGRMPLYHMDLYRLGGEEEAWDLGLEEYFHGDGVCVVEWPDRLGSTLPKDAIEIIIEQLADKRAFHIRGRYGRACDRVKELSTS